MPPTTHASLGASSAHRWMACPGAPRLEQQIPEDRTSSIHAIEGTAAHELAERCLAFGVNTIDCIGDVITVEGENIVVTEEMAAAVSVYVREVRRCVQSDPDSEFRFELRVNLDKLNPPQPMHGTADAVVWLPKSKELHIFDLKYGQGVVVEVEGNLQIWYYALGAVLTMGVRPEMIYGTIVQPRAEHDEGPVRSTSMRMPDLINFRRDLLAAAEAASAPDAPVGPAGKHCRWCRAKPICPAQRSMAVAVAQSEFDTLPVAGPPPPEALSQEQLLEVMDKASLIEDWLTSVRNYVQTQLEHGHTVEGWKLVAKRATRGWTDEKEAEKALRKQFKVGEIFTKKLLSPAQAEALAKRHAKTLPRDLIVSRSSGHNLARASSSKPAITPGSDAADEFAVITES